MAILRYDRVKGRLFKTPPDVTGDALFSDDGLHRYWLSRYRPKPHDRTILWVGLNPSIAIKDWDDPTISVEWDVSQRQGFNRYLKCNVMSRVATNPDDLINYGDDLVRDLTYMHLENCAKEASVVVVCFGSIRPMLMPFAGTAMQILKRAGHQKLWCIGYNKDATPRHPLYMKRDKKLVRYEGHSCLSV